MTGDLYPIYIGQDHRNILQSYPSGEAEFGLKTAYLSIVAIGDYFAEFANINASCYALDVYHQIPVSTPV